MTAKCIRIEMEYDNGDLYRAEGEDAEEIRKAIVAAQILEAVHGREWRGPQLKKVEK